MGGGGIKKKVSPFLTQTLLGLSTGFGKNYSREAVRGKLPLPIVESVVDRERLDKCWGR